MKEHITPSFEIDEKGRVYCRMHTKYRKHIEKKDYFEYMLLEKDLTCMRCGHYKSDDCYFPRSELDKIVHDQEKEKHFSCRLCGSQIKIMLTIVQKLYYEEKFNLKMQLICCDCHQKLSENRYRQESLNKILALGFIVSVSLFFFIYASIISFLLGTNLITFIFLFICWCFIVFLPARKIVRICRGLIYYKKFFCKNKLLRLT
ncbi:MAG: hypothetical protein JW891_05060 [Candidatus Lokiarchaeota archaeon]|nr:hypothetical protein [Candidatus Lokiarchaeota archaeon]